jgi:hypothetical protein
LTGKANRKPPNFDLHKSLYRMAGIDFGKIDGLDALKAS